MLPLGNWDPLGWAMLPTQGASAGPYTNEGIQYGPAKQSPCFSAP